MLRVPFGEFVAVAAAGRSPAAVAGVSAGVVIAALSASSLLHDGDVARRAFKWVLGRVRQLAAPLVRKAVDDAARGITFPTNGSYETFASLPERGLSHKDLLRVSGALQQHLDKDMSKERLSGVVYVGTDGKTDAIADVIKAHLWSNPLFADYFGAARKIEAEVVQMMLGVFAGKTSADVPHAEQQVGCYTFGGTESILMAMLAMRNYAREVRGIKRPNVIVPTSAHPAFDKAATYFGIRIVKVAPEPGTFAVDPNEVERHITYETIGIVGSAPSFAHGTIDPIEELSVLAVRRNVLLHVDACLGGMLIQFMQAAGFQQPVIDFRLPGVTSISCDIHKWGGAPKGASVVLYRGAWLRQHQTFAFADYPGGLYVTASINGSKAGYVIAAAWAALLSTGREQYVAHARAVVTATAAFRQAVESIPLLSIVGRPEVSTVAFTSPLLDIYQIKAKMGERGWILNPCQFPPCVHLGVTLEHTRPGAMATLIRDLTAVVDDMCREVGFESPDAAAAALRKGTIRGNQAHKSLVYGSTQSVPDRSIIEQVLRRYVDGYYVNPIASSTAAGAGAH